MLRLCIEVPHLQLAQQTHADHLDPAQDQYSGNNKQRPVLAPDIVTPDHAVRNVLADLRDNVPYSLTHGSYRPHYNARRDALERAFDRMESS